MADTNTADVLQSVRNRAVELADQAFDRLDWDVELPLEQLNPALDVMLAVVNNRPHALLGTMVEQAPEATVSLPREFVSGLVKWLQSERVPGFLTDRSPLAASLAAHDAKYAAVKQRSLEAVRSAEIVFDGDHASITVETGPGASRTLYIDVDGQND